MQILKEVYPNKLRSLSVLSDDAVSVTVMILVAVGSRYESENEMGLAHFVEHTIFKGTKTRPSSKQIGIEIESLGGSSNAFTAYDYTGYYIKAPAENFEKTFEILADMFQNSLFAAEEIEKERGVIIEEIKMYEDRPASKIMQTWNAALYDGNSLGRDIAGTEASVAAMQQQQFTDFLQKHYYAENTLVVVAGKVAQEKVIENTRRLLGNLPQMQSTPSSYTDFTKSTEELPAENKLININKDVEQSHIVLGGYALQRNHKDRFALRVADTILGSGFGSRLFQVIRDELGLAYYVYSRLSSYNDTGNFVVGMGIKQGKEQLAIDAVLKELENIVSGSFAENEFVRAKNYVLGGMVTEMETTEDIASFYGMRDLLGMEELTIQEIKEKIAAVQLDEVVGIARQIYTPENYTLASLTRSPLQLKL